MFVERMAHVSHISNLKIITACLVLWFMGTGMQAQTNSTQSQNNSIQIQNNNQSQSNSLQSFSKKKSPGYGSGSYYLDSAQYYTEKNPIRAIEFINKAIEESIRLNDKNKESLAYLILGNIQQGLMQHDMAVENYKKSINVSVRRSNLKLSYSGTENELTLFNAYKQMAVSLIELNDLSTALARINSCLGYSSIPLADMLSAQRVLATVKLKQNQVQESISLLNEVLGKEKQINHSSGEIETDIALGEAYQLQKNEDKAIEYYTAAKLLADKTNQPKLALKANDLLAKLFRKQKNVSKEIEARNSNILINSNANNSQAVVKENIEIGNAFLNNDQMAMAQTYYDKGLTQFANQSLSTNNSSGSVIKSNDLDETANTYKLLAQQFLKQNDPVKSLDYFNKYALLQDSIKHVRQRELDQAISLSNSLGKNQQRIDLLEKERELSEKSLEILKQDKDLKEGQLSLKNIIIGVLGFSLLSILLAGYFVIRSFKEKRKANQLLALKSLRGQMNPHFIFNALNSVNHYISQNDERKANRYLSDFSKLMRMVMDSSKHSLIPLTEELDMLKLYVQLEHVRFNDKFDYTFDVSDSVSDSEFELPPMLVQPYIENAIWHGLRYLDYKGKLSIVFKEQGGELVIVIADDGIGRNKSLELKTLNQKKQLSIGMQNIENRIGIMNDVFDTNIRVEITDADSTAHNCGTNVTLFIPQKKQ